MEPILHIGVIFSQYKWKLHNEEQEVPYILTQLKVLSLQLSAWFAVWLGLDLESDLFMNWKNIACSIFKSSIQIIALSGWHPSKDILY